MFEGLKNLLGVPVSPHSTLRNALAPLRAVDASLVAVAASYVDSGLHPEFIHEVERRKPPLLDDLFIFPGRLSPWSWPTESTVELLKGIGLDRDQVVRARHLFYASDASPAQFVRFGRLLAALSLDVNRGSAGVPVWLTALVNDMANTFPNDNLSEATVIQRVPRWRPELIEALLDEAGEEPARRVVTTLAALLPQCDTLYGYCFGPHRLPGLTEYLTRHGAELTPELVSAWTAPSRIDLVERTEGNPALAIALAPVIAAACVDPAKGVRTAALRALADLSPTTRAEVLPPVLVTAPASRAGGLVELLSRDAAGAALLRTAVESGAKFAALVDQAGRRRDAIAEEVVAESLELPPFEPLVETDNAEAIKAELRRMLASRIALGETSGEQWARKAAATARAVTEGELDEFVRAAEGRSDRPKLMVRYRLWTLVDAASALNLIQVLRLGRIETSPLSGLIQFKVRLSYEGDVDLRIVADAAERAGVRDLDLPALVTSSVISPESAWPYLAEHPDILQRWLAGPPGDVATALAVLARFPRPPQSVLPQVAAVALGDGKLNRARAQSVLSGHPAALSLAEQGVGSSKGEIRVAAAGWLAGLGNPAGIPALRAALTKETREVVRAALLAALESLGDDISSDLAPAVLLAEATKGLRAKPPASMSWLNLDLIPAARWADGTPVDPTILRWWHVLAVKLKDPDGSGLIDRYLSLLNADDAAGIGRFALRSWVAQDTQHPTEDDSRAHAAAVGPRRWKDNQDWLARSRSTVGMGPDYLRWFEEQAALPVEVLTARAFDEHQATYLGSATADKGLLALTTRLPGGELATATQAYIRTTSGRRAQLESLVTALLGNGDPAAVQLLLAISRRFKQQTVQAKARECVERLAESRGWTPDELADRTIPTAGFSADRLLHLNYGPREFLGRVTAKGGIELADAEGKVLQALPAPRAGDDEEVAAAAKKHLATARTELKAVLRLQSARLYEAMCAQRVWAASDWQEFLALHPLVSGLVAGLIWVESTEGGRRLFRPTEDGELIGVDDDPIRPASGSSVSLAHRVLMTGDEADAWRAHLDDYSVTPLFDQLGAVLPAVAENATEVDDLSGHLSDTFHFRGVAGKRGYTRGSAEDGAWFGEYTKSFQSVGLTAVLEFTGSFLPEENIACATESLSFRRHHRPVPLTEVPPVLLAECYADYAAFAALGPFDADYVNKTGH